MSETSIYDILDQLRADSLDEKDKGDKFEALIKAFLETDAEWRARFSEVEHFTKWKHRGNHGDIGIDLVAKNRDDDGWSAIQCKFYAANATVMKEHIDSFLSLSYRPDYNFTRRYIFDTAAKWSKNAEETLQGQVQRIDISQLDDSSIDWAKWSIDRLTDLTQTEKKLARRHQLEAIVAVNDGLETHARGKLIMACGTGKTFTSLKIAEDRAGKGGRVLFLVPSIQLLSQSLREWMAQTSVGIHPFAVCSDVRVGRRSSNNDFEDQSVVDLSEPPTTDATTLALRMASADTERMTVVFSTYQSIDVIVEAQRQGLAEFDLVICDEAHRTSGAILADGNESHFLRIHDNDALRSKKRLYMTATPKVFSDAVKAKAAEKDAVLFDMSDEAIFGPELHRLGFGEAVERDLLTDYKVLVLAVDERHVSEKFQQMFGPEIELDAAAKLLGCWNGLNKRFTEHDDTIKSLAQMRTAVAFAANIKASKAASDALPAVGDFANGVIPANSARRPLRLEAKHVDGTMGIHERNTKLAWLKTEPPEGTCRILTNARCLSEGVDVPALDAVMFLTPRGSQVDVVQSVGRVMRKAEGKELGYIILPIVIPAGVPADEALNDNERYKVVWQVLQALRAHDDRFNAMVNQIELNKKKPKQIDIFTIDGSEFGGDGADDTAGDEPSQLTFPIPEAELRDAMLARIVKKVGERQYWQRWAAEVADIAHNHIVRIEGALTDTKSKQAKEFAKFLHGLRANLNENITEREAVEMLAQHLITRPIFEALFEGYDFAAHNPVAQVMERMLDVLDEHNIDAEAAKLDEFYRNVRRRVEGVDNAEGKQKILVELYDNFFAAAFKGTVEKLGIVYTPIELVDFMLRSADAVLKSEFGQSLTDENIHIVDGFTGTGTFLVRLLQSGLIKPADLARKYASELHGNEILLLAYYIACVNIETTYQELTGESTAFSGLILTDTFQSWEPDDRLDDEVFKDNNARLEALKKLPITVILGNPPYSVGQTSANDNNANDSYPALDDAIRSAYLPDRGRGGNNSMFDSYIRAIRWASLRLHERGVIAFITNGGFIDSNTADGMRRHLAKEFSNIHIYNLRGNQRTAGEQSRKEGGKIFGSGSRATIAITVLVRNPEVTGQATIHYTDIGDYLTREQKLAKVAEAENILALTDTCAIAPNEHGDWLNQRRDDFERFIPVGAKHGADVLGDTVFHLYSRGLETGRDAWIYHSSSTEAAAHVERTISAFNEQVEGFAAFVLKNGISDKERKSAVDRYIDADPTKISWTLSLKNRLRAERKISFAADRIQVAMYRPFFKQQAYVDKPLNHISGQLPRMFPFPGAENSGIVLTGVSSHYDFTPFMTNAVPDLHLLDTGQYFPRYRYEEAEGSLNVDADAEIVGGYRRIDNITDASLTAFKTAYGTDAITKDDIFFYMYGLFHSTEYREGYAADLKRMLPRIPFVRSFTEYAEAGRRLARLHLNYEDVEPYPLDGLDAQPVGLIDPYAFYAVGGKMKFAGRRPNIDRSTIIYNDHITLTGIPDQAHAYQIGSRSAIEWLIDRYYIKTDRASGIVNDPNDWSREVGDPRYILDLIARITAVSVETVAIVNALPALEILEMANA